MSTARIAILKVQNSYGKVNKRYLYEGIDFDGSLLYILKNSKEAIITSSNTFDGISDHLHDKKRKIISTEWL